MDDIKLLGILLGRATRDQTLMPFHLSLYAVLCQTWIEHQCQNPFQISRSKVMKASRIRSQATYHKVIKELQTRGHIIYKPSYHPRKGSLIFLH